MKTIALSEKSYTLEHTLLLASQDNVILETPDGRMFILAEVDDFAEEVALVRQNDELMAFLAERSKETERIPQSQVRAMLDLDEWEVQHNLSESRS